MLLGDDSKIPARNASTRDEENRLLYGEQFQELGRDPYLLEIDDLINLHNKKKHDYANSGNQFSNFEEAAKYAGISVEQAFDIFIGTKIARLLNLKKSGNHPKNEAILDTELDLANYIIIKRAYIRHKRMMYQNAKVATQSELNRAITSARGGFPGA